MRNMISGLRNLGNALTSADGPGNRQMRSLFVAVLREHDISFIKLGDSIESGRLHHHDRK
ncbi:protein of unknown function (plasmid) [Agrobacterium pusense]|uniref:Uncharacterized protein n=1 Tax=Agrobacterium pusense TaxID=648995 RepID=U4QFC2_9HYPH|nr:protein of unknown function [Agrobacterium pusense]